MKAFLIHSLLLPFVFGAKDLGKLKEKEFCASNSNKVTSISAENLVCQSKNDSAGGMSYEALGEKRHYKITGEAGKLGVLKLEHSAQSGSGDSDEDSPFGELTFPEYPDFKYIHEKFEIHVPPRTRLEGKAWGNQAEIALQFRASEVSDAKETTALSSTSSAPKSKTTPVKKPQVIHMSFLVSFASFAGDNGFFEEIIDGEVSGDLGIVSSILEQPNVAYRSYEGCEEGTTHVLIINSLAINEKQAQRFHDKYKPYLYDGKVQNDSVLVKNLKLNTIFDNHCEPLQKFSTGWAIAFILMVFLGLLLLALVAISDKFRKNRKKAVTPVKNRSNSAGSNRTSGGTPWSETASRDSFPGFRNDVGGIDV